MTRASRNHLVGVIGWIIGPLLWLCPSGYLSADHALLKMTSVDLQNNGNNEGNVRIGADQVSRDTLLSGRVGTWTTTTELPAPRGRKPASVAYNGYLYVLGGAVSGAMSRDVQYAPTQPTGAIGPWNPTTPLPTPRELHTALAYNGYVYLIGGNCTSSAGAPCLESPTRDVHVAQVKSDGTLGEWKPTSALPVRRYGHASLVYDGYLYVLGGDGEGSRLDDVQVAVINADGTLGEWTATTPFPTARSDFGSMAYNGYLYVTWGVVAGHSCRTSSMPPSWRVGG